MCFRDEVKASQHRHHTQVPIAPQIECSGISVQDGTACASGTRQLESDEVAQCMTIICPQIGVWSIVGYAVPGSAVVGEGYIAGCGTNTYSGVPGQTLCVSGTPKPTPAPGPTPKPTPTPKVCSRIYINGSSAATCDAGWEASSEDVHSCLRTICRMMEPWSKAKYADPDMMVVGNGYDATCGPQPKDGGLGDSICVSSVPIPPPTPTPLPTPTPKVCSRIYINGSSAATCNAGWEASSEDVHSCMDTICNMMEIWAKAKYADPDMMVVGAGYDATCGPLPKSGDVGDSICVSSSMHAAKPDTPLVRFQG